MGNRILVYDLHSRERWQSCSWRTSSRVSRSPRTAQICSWEDSIAVSFQIAVSDRQQHLAIAPASVAPGTVHQHLGPYY